MSKLGFTTFLTIIYSCIMYLLRSGMIQGVEVTIHLVTHIFILLIILAIFVFRASSYFSTRMQILITIFFYSIFYFFTTYKGGKFDAAAFLFELLIVLIAFYLSHQMFIAIREIQRTGARLTFSDIKYDVGVLEDAAKITESYLVRSKREKEPLSFLLVHYEPVSYKQVKSLTKNRLSDLFLERRLEKSALRSILSNIRETDSFVETRDGCILLLPKTKLDQAQFFITRLETNFEDDMHFKLTINGAEYPTNGENYVELVKYCEKKNRE